MSFKGTCHLPFSGALFLCDPERSDFGAVLLSWCSHFRSQYFALNPPGLKRLLDRSNLIATNRHFLQFMRIVITAAKWTFFVYPSFSAFRTEDPSTPFALPKIRHISCTATRTIFGHLSTLQFSKLIRSKFKFNLLAQSWF
jgi:hypothetical protein